MIVHLNLFEFFFSFMNLWEWATSPSSSSSDEKTIFKPLSLPETIAHQLDSKLSQDSTENNSDHKESFAIIDDGNISGR